VEGEEIMAWQQPTIAGDTQEFNMSSIKEFTKGDFIKMSMLKCIEAQNDVEKFVTSVQILEAMMQTELAKEKDYYDNCKILNEQMKLEMGSAEYKLGKLYLYKFTKLIDLVFKQTPMEVVGVLTSPKRQEEMIIKQELKGLG
jgi:hypothetical protein